MDTLGIRPELGNFVIGEFPNCDNQSAGFQLSWWESMSHLEEFSYQATKNTESEIFFRIFEFKYSKDGTMFFVAR